MSSAEGVVVDADVVDETGKVVVSTIVKLADIKFTGRRGVAGTGGGGVGGFELAVKVIVEGGTREDTCGEVPGVVVDGGGGVGGEIGVATIGLVDFTAGEVGVELGGGELPVISSATADNGDSVARI